jgi:hypothetical protein
VSVPVFSFLFLSSLRVIDDQGWLDRSDQGWLDRSEQIRPLGEGEMRRSKTNLGFRHPSPMLPSCSALGGLVGA